MICLFVFLLNWLSGKRNKEDYVRSCYSFHCECLSEEKKQSNQQVQKQENILLHRQIKVFIYQTVKSITPIHPNITAHWRLARGSCRSRSEDQTFLFSATLSSSLRSQCAQTTDFIMYCYFKTTTFWPKPLYVQGARFQCVGGGGRTSSVSWRCGGGGRCDEQQTCSIKGRGVAHLMMCLRD